MAKEMKPYLPETLPVTYLPIERSKSMITAEKLREMARSMRVKRITDLEVELRKEATKGFESTYWDGDLDVDDLSYLEELGYTVIESESRTWKWFITWYK